MIDTLIELRDPPGEPQRGRRDVTRSRGIRARRPGAGRDGMSRSGSVEAQAPTHLVLVHDRVGVAAGDAGVVGQPVGLFFTAEECGASFEPVEPLSEGAAGCDRNARDEATVQIR
jgi:hypothetical protein